MTEGSSEKRECFVFICEKKKNEESVAHKKSRGSSSSSFDMKRFVSADAEARFHDLVKRRARLKERGFELDSSHLEYFETIIAQRSCRSSVSPPRRQR